MFKHSRTFLFLVFLLCLTSLGAEFFFILNNGFSNHEEVLFEIIIISFFGAILGYLFFSFYKKTISQNKNDIEF